jgi:putative ABC transport system permease protein
MSLLFRAALRIVPSTWRDSVEEDLEAAARRAGRGELWRVWQAAVLGIRLRSAIQVDLVTSDFRYALRSLSHAPSFAAGAISTFALGIGVNIAVFAAVDHMLFKPLPYAAPSELIQFRVCGETGTCQGSFPSALFVDGRTTLTTIWPMAIAGSTSGYDVAPVVPDQPPVRLHGATPNLLSVLGVRPVLGRDITPEDAAAKANVALLSYETWQRRFGGTPDLQSLRLVQGPKTVKVIGILPRGFAPPSGVQQDADWDGLVMAGDAWTTPRGEGSIHPPLARLKPGASVDAARAEMTSLIAARSAELRQWNSRAQPRIQIDRLETSLYDRFLKYAWLIVGASALILVMACVNLSGLLLVRGRSRQGDAALRVALGATSGRLILTSVFETLVIAISGAAIALVVFAATSRLMIALLPPMFARYMADAANPRVLWLALVSATACAAVAGLWPGLVAARSDVRSQLGGVERRHTRVRGGRTMLALEAALGVVLVLGAVLFLASFVKLTSEELGVRPDGLFRVRNAYSSVQNPGAAGYEDVVQALSEIPGIAGIAGGDSVVGGGGVPMRGFSSDRSVRGGRYQVTAGYFSAIGNPLLAGREFTREEVSARAPVVVLDRTGATFMFPGDVPASVVGRTLNLPGEVPRTIIGVATDVRHRYGADLTPSIYVPLGAEMSRYSDMVARVDPTSMSATELRNRINQRLQTDKVVVAHVPELMEPGLRDPRFQAVLLGCLALAGLLLSAGGLYALAAFEVALRRQEIGVRMALGATAAQIRALMIRESVRPVLVGTAAGLLVAWWGSSVFQSLLYRLDARGPEIYSVGAVTLVLSAVLAAWIPARRAARTDPAVVLRSQ